LFIGTLAFEGVDKAAAVRIGVIMGSLLAGASGYVLLRFTKITIPATVPSSRASSEPAS
jgi:Na+/H+ antiporter NhaA